MIKKTSLNKHMIIIFFSFLICLYAPYEMYITNVNEFWFSLKDFIIYLFIFAFLMILALEFIIKKLPASVNEYMIAFLLFLEIAIYCQGNFLNIDIGPLTGIQNRFNFREYYVEYIKDVFVWMLIGGGILFLLHNRKSLYNKISLILPTFLLSVLFITAIVLFVFSFSDEIRKTKDTKFYSTYRLTTVGDTDNIIVFLLDMFDRDYLNKIVEDNNEVLDDFDGFTIYGNYISGYPTTNLSTILMNNGVYFKNEKPNYEFLNEERVSYIDILKENGYQVENYALYGFSDRIINSFTNRKDGVMQINNRVRFIAHIYKMGAFRYAPNVFKKLLIGFNNEFNEDRLIVSDYELYDRDNIILYDNICKSPMKVEKGNDFKIIYSNGTHYPYRNDENLNITDNNDPVKCGIGALKVVAEYINKLKNAGVYDNTTIIITADHGYFADYMDSFTQPIFMIKPKASHGEITFNYAPVTQRDFPATIVGIVQGNNENLFGKSIFAYNEGDSRERLYYHYYFTDRDYYSGRWRLIEFSVDDDSTKEDSYHLTGNEYTYHGNLINHFEYCNTCKTGDNEGKGACWHAKTSDYPE